MDEHEIEVDSVIDAKKETIDAAEGCKLAIQSTRVLAAKGKNVVEFHLDGGQLSGEDTADNLRKAIIGPSGNLRAPSIWVGQTLIVGFHPDMYASVLG